MQSLSEDEETKPPTIFYRLFGYWIRREACRLAAQAVQGPWSQDRDVAHLLWSLTVFFESYMVDGCEHTAEEFGPREPVDLGLVRGSVVTPKVKA